MGRDAPGFGVSTLDQHPNERGRDLVVKVLETFLQSPLESSPDEPEPIRNWDSLMCWLRNRMEGIANLSLPVHRTRVIEMLSF